MMEWTKLLSRDRSQKPAKLWLDAPRSPWQSDYDKIVFCSAFRRLQDKTQVFPLSSSDFVRTRLTHSLEVSTIARTLGTIVGADIVERHGDETSEHSGKSRSLRSVITPDDVGAIVAAAALAHDLGNPPFGHSGEDAVRHWYSTTDSVQLKHGILSGPLAYDFQNWEGNAQGFRIITKLQMHRADGGLRLTYATLAAFSKYPGESSKPRQRNEDCAASQKKHGFFQSEKSVFEEVALATGLIRRPTSKAQWCRHPLAFLMEAADDISYRLIDLEDGHRLGLVRYEDVCGLFREISPEVSEKQLSVKYDDRTRIAYLRDKAIHKLIKAVAAVFTEREAEILEGRLDVNLTMLIPAKQILSAIRDQMTNSVYKDERVLEVEAAGFEIIPGLLDIFWEAVSRRSSHRHHRKADKILQLIPKEYVGPDGDSSAETYERLLLIADHVSGMTDSYALSLYRKLKGIALPS